MLLSCRLLCSRTWQKPSDYLSLTRDQKNVIIVIILLSHGIYMKDNWRLSGMVLQIQTWLCIRARLGLHLFRLCRLRTIRYCGFQSGHRLIILSRYLLMGAGRLVALLSWVLALSGPTDWGQGWWMSKHHTESRTQVWGLGVQVWTGTWTPRQESGGLVLLVPRVHVGRVFWGTQLGYIGS